MPAKRGALQAASAAPDESSDAAYHASRPYRFVVAVSIALQQHASHLLILIPRVPKMGFELTRNDNCVVNLKDGSVAALAGLVAV